MYKPQAYSLYKNNPAIEALGEELNKETMLRAIRHPIQTNIDDRYINDENRITVIHDIVDNMNFYHEPRDEAYNLYKTLFRIIRVGYSKRNPIHRISELLNIINSKIEPEMHYKMQRCTESTNISSAVVIGLSGVGKSQLIDSCLWEIPQLIEHKQYTTDKGETHDLNFIQIVFLKVTISNRKGEKHILRSILESIDKLLGTQYNDDSSYTTVQSYLMRVKKACITHCIGLIIFDEAQNLTRHATSKSSNSIHESIRFVEELINNISVPTIFIGTHSMLNLFQSEMRLARRITSNGCIKIQPPEVESSFWIRLCKSLFFTSCLANQTSSFDEFKNDLHFLSCGLPAIAVNLSKQTLNYLIDQPNHQQNLGSDSLRIIYKIRFEPLHLALDALRNGEYHRFEDFILLADDFITSLALDPVVKNTC